MPSVIVGHGPRGGLSTPTDLSRRLSRAIPGSFLLLSLIVLLLSDYSRLLGDPDCIWHVAVGRWIWVHKAVPWTDVFSHTFGGAPWIAKEWLSQLIFYAVHEGAGWWGVVMMTVSAIGVSFVILQEWLLRRLCPSVAIVATVIAILLFSVHFVARPHVLVLPILVLWMTGIVRAADEGQVPPLRLVLLMVLWVNMHGSFPLGLAMAGILGCEGVLIRPAAERLGAAWGWALFMAATCAATLVSPYGWHAITVPLQMGNNAETLRFIDEWKPLSLDLQGGVALAVLVVVPLLMARKARTEAFRILATGLLGYMMIRHVRFVSLFGIISTILATRVLALRWGAAARKQWEPQTFLVGLLIPSLMAVLFDIVTMRPAPDPKVAPEAAVHAALAYGVNAPIYNAYNFGGYLIASGIKTFIDGRTDQLFLGDFLPKLEAAVADADDTAFTRILDHYRVGWALVRTGSRDSVHLSRMAGWSRVYADDVANVFIRADARTIPSLDPL
jgi:hypothetical protein